MRNEIVENINKNNVMSFDKMFEELKKTYPELNSSILAKTIRSLSSEGKVISSSRYLYNPESLEKAEGYVHWNVNQLSWLEPEDKTNNFGIAFNGSENLLVIANKKEALYGSKVGGYKLVDPETQKTSFYVAETLEMKPVSLFVILNTKENNWTILNSNIGMTIGVQAFPINNFQNGDIVKLDSLDFNIYEKFGNISDKGIESNMLQALADIKEAPTVDLNDIQKQDLPLDNSPFYTIDSIYTKDIDDAIFCEKKHDGSFTLKVAIADVSSFIEPNSILDLHAEKVSSSFYLQNKVVHMLSRNIAENYCSLNVGQERLAMIANIEISAEGLVTKFSFDNKKIMSHARLTYDDVNNLLNNQPMVESLTIEEGSSNKVVEYHSNAVIEKSLKDLYDLSQILHTPYKPTYWFVPSVQLDLGENGKVSSLFIEQRENSKSQIMVETAMLIANKTAAQFLHDNNINASALFRNQVAPLDELDRPKPAQYGSINEGHWGLNAEYYTHFTSPIRRYCDLMVHRMIKSVLSNENTKDLTDNLTQIATQINSQQYKDKVCSNREVSLLLNQYLEHLVNNKELNAKFNIVDYSENGVVFRNSQLIEFYVPNFKLDRILQDLIKPLVLENLNPENKTLKIQELNDNFKYKCFLDRYNWINDFKEITFKMYPREANEIKSTSSTSRKKM